MVAITSASVGEDALPNAAPLGTVPLTW